MLLSLLIVIDSLLVLDVPLVAWSGSAAAELLMTVGMPTPSVASLESLWGSSSSR